jgi:hypothetical protein
MQPRPIAETSRPLRPRVRLVIMLVSAFGVALGRFGWVRDGRNITVMARPSSIPACMLGGVDLEGRRPGSGRLEVVDD